MKQLLPIALLALAPGGFAQDPHDYGELRRQAEEHCDAKSWALARDLYERADALALDPAEARWVDFRLGDCRWRAAAGSGHADTTELERGRSALEQLVQGVERAEDKDRVWVLVQESLGDYHWLRAHDWSTGWPYYQRALDHWSASTDIEAARARYLDLVWRVTEAHGYGENFHSWMPQLPIRIADGALRIARDDAERARAHYLAARLLQRSRGDVEGRRRVFRELEAVLEVGRGQPFYDDALFALAGLHANQGQPETDERGGLRYQRDYRAAVALYRRLLEEFRKGESAFRDDAQRAVEEITSPSVGVTAGQVFLPGSKVRVGLAWRNLERVDLALIPVDLTEDVHLDGPDTSADEWLASIQIRGRQRLMAWTEQVEDRGDHAPGSQAIVLDADMEPGAYVLEASGGGETARELVLVGDTALIVQSVEGHALVWLTRAEDGRPVPAARVHVWARHRDDSSWTWREHTGITDADGLARFRLAPSRRSSRQLFAATNAAGTQAFARGWASSDMNPDESWRLYATTDRPAYRPEDSVKWKLVARRSSSEGESGYAVPEGAELDWRIEDPMGAEAGSGTVRLNAFGSASGELQLEAAWPLGEYRVTWRSKGSTLGSATLFRLEEYKLPEFRVSVSTPEVPGSPGKRQAFKSGETVSVEVQAEYYFGGPVSGASAEVLVYRKNFWPRWQRERRYPWYFEGSSPGYRGYASEQLVTQETRETDAEGKLTVTFATEPNPGVDYEYRVEARVIDASRREVSGSGTVRVARQRYQVNARARHNLHRPGDEVEVDFQSQDANGEPFPAEGQVRVSRTRTVEQEELTLQEHEQVLMRLVSTDAEGRGTLAFTPERTGVYRIVWTGRDDDGITVTAETTVWVADDATTELGVRHGALAIVLDDDTFKSGDDAAVMLTAPSAGRWVLFVQTADGLFDARVVHLTGSVKLLTLAIDERHVPNVFLQAWMVSDRAVWNDAAEVIVPPADKFLEVSVTSGAPEARPGAEDVLTVTTRDHTGEPVAAEVELALVDEAVLAIQTDYAGDPRPFFYGRKRRNRLSFHSSMQQRAFVHWSEDDDGKLYHDRQEGERQAGAGGGGPLGSSGADEFRLGRGAASKDSGRYAAPSAPGVVGQRLEAEESLGAKRQRGLDDAVRPDEAGPGGGSTLVVRSDFRTTALWEPALVTGADGTARVPVRYPDSTTRWRALARVADQQSRFGTAETHTRTSMPLQVRLQAPRFFVVGDRCVVSALIDNNSEGELTVRPELVADGLQRLSTPDELVTIAAGAQARVDWSVSAFEPGEARLVVSARSAELADGMERTLTVHEHGIDKLVAKSAKLTADELVLTLELPAARRLGSTSFDVRIAPSLAVTMLDALPYLIEYPYGCVEQTMSRFLPAVVTARTLAQLGLEPEDVAGRMFGGIEQEHAAQTHTRGPRDLARLDEVVSASVARLVDFQHADGGWGWWKHGDSDPFMSAYVLWGLSLASAAEVDVPAGVLERAARFVTLELVEAEHQLDLQAWMLHALAVHLDQSDGRPDQPPVVAAADNIWRRREALNAYSRALFALATHHLGQSERARILSDNLRNGVVVDHAPDVSVVQRGVGSSDPDAHKTAHWGQDGIQRRWSSGSVEATAFCLRALIAIDPESDLSDLPDLIGPTTHWLVRNRRGAQWSHTRDTAISVLALNDYLRASGELATELDYELWVNGTRVASRSVTPADVIAAPNLFSVPDELVRDGANEVRLLRTRGAGALYLSAEARFFSLEEPVSPAGNELFARREYNRLTAVPTLLSGTVIEKRPWSEGDAVPSGERVQVVITLEAKNDLEYLVIEDLKPAGLEATVVKSGEPLAIRELKSGALGRSLGAGGRANEERDYTGRRRQVHQELRDRKVALFVDKLPQGTWELTYELRAEVPGEFHALPVMGHAMYVPEIRCNGREVGFRVVD